MEFFCLKDPPAAFLGLANLSLIFSKSFFPIYTSPRTSKISGGSNNFFGISSIVAKFSVIFSPKVPSPLDKPKTKSPFSYLKVDDIPSILFSDED